MASRWFPVLFYMEPTTNTDGTATADADTNTTNPTGADAAGAGDDAGEDSGATHKDRQTKRLGDIMAGLARLAKFTDKCPSGDAAPGWANDLRSAVDMASGALADAAAALEAMPDDYKHKAKRPPRTEITAGDAVRVADAYAPNLKGLLADVEFGCTAIGKAAGAPDDRARVVVHWIAKDGTRVGSAVPLRFLAKVQPDAADAPAAE